jgi:hypothetical protein
VDRAKVEARDCYVVGGTTGKSESGSVKIGVSNLTDVDSLSVCGLENLIDANGASGELCVLQKEIAAGVRKRKGDSGDVTNFDEFAGC